MLAAHDLAAAPLFVLPETDVDGQGLLPDARHRAAARLVRASWPPTPTRAPRSSGRPLDGALAALGPGRRRARRRRRRPGRGRRRRWTSGYAPPTAAAPSTVEHGLQRRRAAARRGARPLAGVRRHRRVHARAGGAGRPAARPDRRRGHRPAGARRRSCRTALESQLVTLLRGVAADAAEQAVPGWQAHPAGRRAARARAGPAVRRPAERADRLVRDWQRGVLDLVRAARPATSGSWRAPRRTRSTPSAWP